MKAMSETQLPPIKVKHLTGDLIVFYAGRDQSPRHMEEHNWVDDSAIKLGTAMYAIHSGAEAVVYDTFTSVPHAELVRGYLERRGIKRFTVVLSHWHLDHIAGNVVFADCPIIATSLTRDAMLKRKADIEAGKVWGPPAIKPLIYPNIMFDDHLELRVGEIALDLRRINIHSIDGCVVYLPKEKLLLAGDTLEDPLTYMIEVENLAEHLGNLKKMRDWDIAKIFPNHGDPNVIMKGGFDKTLIDATISYVAKMLTRAHDAGYLQGTMEDYIGPEAANGWIHPFEPYREVHEQNLKLAHDYWKDRILPEAAV
jgi:glyoxylase-like metal-dependent hydrolase (beta-lactamase superfamily II)